MILNDVIASLEEGRCPILLTERKDHLAYFAERLQKFAKHLVVLHGSMTARGRNAAKDHLAAVPPDEERLVLAPVDTSANSNSGHHIRTGRTKSTIARLNLAGSSTNGSCPDSSNQTSVFDGAVSASK